MRLWTWHGEEIPMGWRLIPSQCLASILEWFHRVLKSPWEKKRTADLAEVWCYLLVLLEFFFQEGFAVSHLVTACFIQFMKMTVLLPTISARRCICTTLGNCVVLRWEVWSNHYERQRIFVELDTWLLDGVKVHMNTDFPCCGNFESEGFVSLP